MLTRRSSKKVFCSICHTICVNQIGRIQCRHNYCCQCILKWSVIKNSCPICKATISKVQKLKIGNLKKFTRKLKYVEPEMVDISPPQEDDSEYQQLQEQSSQIITARQYTQSQPQMSQDTLNLLHLLGLYVGFNTRSRDNIPSFYESRQI